MTLEIGAIYELKGELLVSVREPNPVHAGDVQRLIGKIDVAMDDVEQDRKQVLFMLCTPAGNA